MHAYRQFTITVAKVPVHVFVDNRFKQIQAFYSQLQSTSAYHNLTITVSRAAERGVTVSEDYRHLRVCGPDIDDLRDPYNLIGLIQATMRFIGLHSTARNVYLLHGSASVLDDRGICFGDDGTSTAKTLSAVECSLVSGSFIVDEFTFIDCETFEAFTYNFVPLHLRPAVKVHLVASHTFAVPRLVCRITDAGIFFAADRLFRTVASKLSQFVFVHFHNDVPKLKCLNAKETRQALSICLGAHTLKLLQPHLDRMRFDGRSDSDIHDEITIDTIKRLPTASSIATASAEIGKRVQCYRAFIREPCDIIELLRAISSAPK